MRPLSHHQAKRRQHMRRLVHRSRLTIIGWFLVGLVFFLPALSPGAQTSGSEDYVAAANARRIPSRVAAALASGQSSELIVLFDDAAVEREASTLRRHAGITHDDAAVLSFKKERFRQIKEKAESRLLPGDLETVRDYSHLPMRFARIRSGAALERLLAQPEIAAVYENSPIQPVLTISLPFINEPAVAALGFTGSGTSVGIIDTGIDYTLPAFGSCTAPGTPAGCRVVASVDVTGNGVTLNKPPYNHGTNVAGIAAGVAPGTGIAAVNAFTNESSTVALVIDAINWTIANKSTYNITAINMSLSDGGYYASPCSDSGTNPFFVPVAAARSAGIIPVAASGNNGFTDGISAPACTPGVVSVGAVYDAAWGGPYSWGSGCTDPAASAPDMIPCFSNSASFLTMLAPGAFITAAGTQMAGTSQASPHAAGAAALLRAAFPADTLDQTVNRLQSGGVPVTDPRNGLTTPRLNLLGALGVPANDNFAARQALTGSSGQVTAINANATKEGGEPNHAGNPGGKSVWWKWVAPAGGVLSLDTHGSGFDTLLAVYTGATVNALTQVAANDNDGSAGNTSGLTFIAQPGMEYEIAVDGYGGAFGDITLTWNLSLQADLAVVMTQDPPDVQAGSNLTYSITVTNNGPSAATGVQVTDTLPDGVAFVSATAGCIQSAGIVGCALGTLGNGGSSTVQIVVNPTAAGNLTNSVTVTSGTPDPASANNSATLSTTVAPPVPVPALSPGGIVGTAGLLLVGIAKISGGRRRGEERF